MRTYICEHIDEIYPTILKDLLSANIVYPRNLKCYEISPATIILTDIRNRTITNEARELLFTFGLAEFLGIMSAKNSVDFITYYNKKMKNYTDNNLTFYGAYGPRLISQIPQIIHKLKSDKDSRQAVMTIYNGNQDLFVQSKDIPCTVSLQFFIRNNKLDLIVYMRSNDIIYGTSYDIQVFTLLQEFIATKLEIEPGNYYHIVGSLHLYDDFKQKAEKIIESKYYLLSWPQMTSEFTNNFDKILYYEQFIRNNDLTQINIFNEFHDSFTLSFLINLILFKFYRLKQKFNNQQIIDFIFKENNVCNYYSRKLL